MFWAWLLAALSTCAATYLAVRVLRPFARRIGLLDRPGGRRKHDAPVPAIGGIALLAASPVALYFLPLTPHLLGLGIGVAILAAAGVADDLFRLSWPYRLSAQILAALAVIHFAGVRIHDLGAVFGIAVSSHGLLSTALTAVVIVGCINAANMVDGVDGLAGSLAMAAAFMLTLGAQHVGDPRLILALALLIGGLFGFLAYNLRTPWNPRAQIFLGNAGSELLGLATVCAILRLTQHPQHAVSVQIAPFFIAPMVIDCLTLMIRRTQAGHSPFVGDRNHMHHMLLDAGFSPSRTVLVMTGLTLAIGAAAGLGLRAHAPAPYFTAAFGLLFLAYYLATADRSRFVDRLATFGRVSGLTPPPKPLEPWQIEAKAAGRYYRRASDRPSTAEPSPQPGATEARPETRHEAERRAAPGPAQVVVGASAEEVSSK